MTFWDAQIATIIGKYRADGGERFHIDLLTGESRYQELGSSPISCLTYDPPSKTLAAGDWAGRVHLIDLSEFTRV